MDCILTLLLLYAIHRKDRTNCSATRTPTFTASLPCRVDPNSCETLHCPCRFAFPMVTYLQMLPNMRSIRTGLYQRQRMGEMPLELSWLTFTRRIWNKNRV